MAKPKGIELGLNCASDYSITDRGGKVYTVEQARKLWESGRVGDHNMGFRRLVNAGWDVSKVRADLEAMDRARFPERYA